MNAIESLMERRGAFDYIILEVLDLDVFFRPFIDTEQTTGLADPGNIAPLFWVDDGLGSTIYLDGIVTVVDAKNIMKSLDEEPAEGHEAPAISKLGASMVVDDAEIPQAYRKKDVPLEHHDSPHLSTANMQVSHADVIVVNKSDLVTEDEMKKVQHRLRDINGLAKMDVTSYSRVMQLEGVLLDLHAYDNVQAEQLDFAEKGHSHLDPVCNSSIWIDCKSNIVQKIGTITIPLPPLRPEQLERLDGWLRSVLWESTLPNQASKPSFEVHRTKGRIALSNGSVKMLQGVREIFEIIDAEVEPQIQHDGKLVFIGRGLIQDMFEQSLRDFMGVS